jgi:hypothetical protein
MGFLVISAETENRYCVFFFRLKPCWQARLLYIGLSVTHCQLPFFFKFFVFVMLPLIMYVSTDFPAVITGIHSCIIVEDFSCKEYISLKLQHVIHRINAAKSLLKREVWKSVIKYQILCSGRGYIGHYKPLFTSDCCTIIILPVTCIL